MHTTHHFEERAESRGLRDDVLDFILAWGREIHAAGAMFIAVFNKDVPEDLRDSRVYRLAEGWVLVMTPCGAYAKTCYRRNNLSGHLRRKMA